MAATPYLVFRRDKESAAWEQIARTEATSSDTAIRQAVVDQEGTHEFVAVPARSWQPRTVTIESKPKVTFGGES